MKRIHPISRDSKFIYACIIPIFHLKNILSLCINQYKYPQKSALDLRQLPQIQNTSALDLRQLPQVPNTSALDLRQLPQVPNTPALDLRQLPQVPNTSALDLQQFPQVEKNISNINNYFFYGKKSYCD
jgi:hypothetical protein